SYLRGELAAEPPAVQHSLRWRVEGEEMLTGAAVLVSLVVKLAERIGPSASLDGHIEMQIDLGASLAQRPLQLRGAGGSEGAEPRAQLVIDRQESRGHDRCVALRSGNEGELPAQ